MLTNLHDTVVAAGQSDVIRGLFRVKGGCIPVYKRVLGRLTREIVYSIHRVYV